MSFERATGTSAHYSLEMDEINQPHVSISFPFYEVPLIVFSACLSFHVYSLIVKIWNRVSQLAWDQFTVSIEVSGAVVNSSPEDAVYYGLINWLSRTYPDLPSRTVAYSLSQFGMRGKPAVIGPPTFGTHYIQYKDHWVRLQRYREPTVRSNYSTCETLILTAWAGQQPILNEIIQEALKQSEVEQDDKMYIYRIYDGMWDDYGPGRNRRPKESVILDSGIIERILTDVKDFLERRAWYLQRDIPHRRGYLLYGPPGCGKTSLVKALAGELGYDIAILSLSAKDLTDDILASLMENAPMESIILMEDIDAAFKSRADPNATSSETNLAFEGRSQNSVTFRGLLNALDGVASAEDGRIVCMTTNYVEKLDPALIRCGRVDLKVFIDYPSDKQLRRLFERFYDEAPEDLTIQFIKCVRDLKQKTSIAMIQGLFLIYKDSAEDAVKYAKEYFEDEFFLGEANSESSVKSVSSSSTAASNS